MILENVITPHFRQRSSSFHVHFSHHVHRRPTIRNAISMTPNHDLDLTDESKNCLHVHKNGRQHLIRPETLFSQSKRTIIKIQRHIPAIIIHDSVIQLIIRRDCIQSIQLKHFSFSL